MPYPLLLSTRWAMAAFLMFAVPNTSAGQTRPRDPDAAAAPRERAVPREAAPAPAPRAEPAPRPAPAPAPAAAPAREPSQAVRRGSPRTVEATGSDSTRGTSQQVQGARPRDGRPIVGTAVPRGSVPPRQNVAPVRYYRGYSPWGFGGVGFGSYYGSFYDPYVFYDPYSPWYRSYGSYGSYGPYGGYGYPSYGYGYPSSYSLPADGELRLKVRPRNAQVFVDGYYVGIVDDFDGIFKRLHLPSGGHRIEVRAPGYETLTFDVQIRFDDTTTFEGELRRIR
jgi:hypothetical protein